MKIVTFTISVEVADGTDVQFGVGDAIPPGPEGDKAAFDSLVPEIAPPATQQIERAFVTSARVNPTCPEHHTSKYVPGGVSKTKRDAQGNAIPYKPFWSCTERTCKWAQDA